MLGNSLHKSGLLDEVVANYPTHIASDHKNRGYIECKSVIKRIGSGKQISLSMVVSSKSGYLNPDWVEWLMGWPVGWTDIDRDDIEINFWASDPADTSEIPRTTTRRQHRAKRLICLGNGQVPQAMALAWETLKAMKEATK